MPSGTLSAPILAGEYDHDALRNLRGQKETMEVYLKQLRAKARELELQLQAKDLIPREQAVTLIYRTLKMVRSLLDYLPARCAQRANPADPALAESAVKEGVDAILKQCAASIERLEEDGTGIPLTF
jgi:hypothetical protein